MDYLIILGLCLVILFVMIFVYIKDRQSDKKFERFDILADDLARQIYNLKKEFLQYTEIIDDMPLDGVSDKIDEEIKNKIEPIVNSIKSIDEVMHNYLKSRGNG